jgi:predicted GNAT family acetyltransferase
VTESFADLSIDTLTGHRRKGIGLAVVAALVEHLLEIGKTPVWGASVDNEASLAMATKLGMTSAAGELYVFQP